MQFKNKQSQRQCFSDETAVKKNFFKKSAAIDVVPLKFLQIFFVVVICVKMFRLNPFYIWGALSLSIVQSL